MFTYSAIKTNFKENNLIFSEKEGYMNLLFIRNNEIFTDKYTDTLVVTYKLKGKEFVELFSCSTKAGTHYVKNPITYLGIKGTAVVVENQQINYEIKDKFLGAIYLAQKEEILIYRDGKIDNDIDKEVKQKGFFGIFVHIAGDFYSNIFNWSAGCFVIPKNKYNVFTELLNIHKNNIGTDIKVAIISNNKFKI